MTVVVESAIAKKLLDAAVRLFAHKGYPATSTREIVEAAGVTKPMLYYYFQSKEGLLTAAIGHFLDEFYARLGEVVAEPMTSRRKLVEVVWAQMDFCQQHKPFARLFYALYFGPDDQKGIVDLCKFTESGHEMLLQVVTQAIEGQCVRADCLEDMTMTLHGMINIWVMAALNDDAELTYELAERVVENMLHGFRIT